MPAPQMLIRNFIAAVFLVMAGGAIAAEPTPAVPDKTVVLTFDDAVASHATFVGPLLRKYGFRATFFVCEFPPDFEDKTKYMTWEQIAALHRDGFEIGSHTRSHKHVDKMRPGELEAELAYIERKCAEHGIARPVSFAYPAYVSTPEAVRVLSEKGYALARVGGSRAYDPAKDDPRLIPSFSTTGSDEKAAARVLAALREAKDGKVVVLTIHGVPDTAHPNVTTAPELFERYLKFLKDEGYKVVALRDLARRARN
jgi:peptidoglycan-N-acetylglucosamine deacetylase